MQIMVAANNLTVPRVAADQLHTPRALSDGALVEVPWIQALILEGYGFGCQVSATDGGLTDPGTFGAGGVDGTEVDLLLTLPSTGTRGIIPIFFKPIFEAIGTIAAVDVLLQYGVGAVIGANSVAITARNMRPDSSNTSLATLAALADTGGTALTAATSGVIYREGGTHLTGVAGTGQTLQPEWSIAKNGYAPVIVGASRQLAAFASAQASTGFIVLQWIEMPNTYFN